MDSASHQRASTCPARLGRRSSKRDADSLFSVWELKDAIGSAPRDDDTVSVASTNTYVSAGPSEASDYGSWPRVRKQRTQETNIMSIFELTAAFDQHTEAPTLAAPLPEPSFAEPTLVASLSMLDETTAELANDAGAAALCAGFDWNALAAADEPEATSTGGIDWGALAGDEEAVAEEAAAELVFQASSSGEDEIARLQNVLSQADTELDAGELMAILAPADMATGDDVSDYTPPASPPRPASPETALAQQLGGLGVAAAVPPPLLPPGATAPTRTAERKEWTAHEDALIRSGVATFGCKWRKIAAQLPGRSDDAVRNRWHRLQAAAGECDEAALLGGLVPAEGVAVPKRRSAAGGRQAAAAKAAAAAADGEGAPSADGAAPAAAKPERLSWTPAEDAIITSSVHEMGHKWFKIAQRLPGRTEHAIRNRYHRLQTAVADQQQQQLLQAAPAFAPPPPPPLLAMPMSVGA